MWLACSHFRSAWHPSTLAFCTGTLTFFGPFLVSSRRVSSSASHFPSMMLVGLVPTFSRVLVFRLRIPRLDLSRLESLFLVQNLEYSLVFDFVCSHSQLFWCRNQKQESCASLTLFLSLFLFIVGSFFCTFACPSG